MPAKQFFLACWKYDTYPYWLCAEITKWKDGGRVNVQGYDGANFTPFKILWGPEAKRVQADHQKLRDDYAKAYTEFMRCWKKASWELIEEDE